MVDGGDGRSAVGTAHTTVRALVLSLACGLGLTACGPDSIEAAELDEVCGEPSPVRIFETDPERSLARVRNHGRFGDRRVLSVHYREESEETSESAKRYEIWSTDECGESPLRMADDVSRLFRMDDVWPGLLFACREGADEVVVLDPTGGRDPAAVFYTQDCRGAARGPRRLDRGLVTIEAHDEDLGALVLHAYPDDPWTQSAEQPTVLLDPIRMRVPGDRFTGSDEVLSITDDGVFAVTPEDELVHLSLLDDTLTVLATDVREFEVGSGLRFVVWQGTEVTDAESEWPEGPVFLLDRETDTVTQLPDTALVYTTWGALLLIEHDILRLRLGPYYGDGGPERFYSLPSMTYVEIPDDVIVLWPVDDHRVLAHPAVFGPYSLVDMFTGEQETLFPRVGSISFFQDGHFEILDGAKCCIEPGSERYEGRLWEVALDGEQRLLAHRATQYRAWLDDGRLVTRLDIDDEETANLILVDAALEESRIDESVISFSLERDWDDSDLLYTVLDGDRTGVWVTALAPGD